VLRELPDEPRWVEAHGIAADPASWRRALGASAVLVGHDAAKLAVACPLGAAGAGIDVRALVAAARELPHVLLVGDPTLAAALREDATRDVARARLHTLPDPDALPDYEGAILLPADAPLPPALADELAFARERGPIWCAYVDGEPVAFACAPWRSARWFDVSVDTLPGARQLGLGTIVAAAMIRDERARGREPVWGADEDNHASLRLAARLGFVAMDELYVAAPRAA